MFDGAISEKSVSERKENAKEKAKWTAVVEETDSVHDQSARDDPLNDTSLFYSGTNIFLSTQIKSIF